MFKNLIGHFATFVTSFYEKILKETVSVIWNEPPYKMTWPSPINRMLKTLIWSKIWKITSFFSDSKMFHSDNSAIENKQFKGKKNIDIKLVFDQTKLSRVPLLISHIAIFSYRVNSAYIHFKQINIILF